MAVDISLHLLSTQHMSHVCCEDNRYNNDQIAFQGIQMEIWLVFGGWFHAVLMMGLFKFSGLKYFLSTLSLRVKYSRTHVHDYRGTSIIQQTLGSEKRCWIGRL